MVLVITYHPPCYDLGWVIRKNLIYFYAKEQVKQVFTPAPFVLLRSGFSLRKHLVREKGYSLLREKESLFCGKIMCETCFNIKETNTFISFVTKKVYKIQHHFHCDSRCIVYLLFCKVCSSEYIGSTVGRFCLRWNNSKCSHSVALEVATPKITYLHQQFLSENHHRLLEDYEMTLIDKINSSDPTRREFFWMYKFKTFAPLPLNIGEIV